MTRMRRLPLAALLALAVLASAGAAPVSAALPPIKHVFIVIMENKSYDETFGSSKPELSYLASQLPAKGALVRNYYAIGHLSLDNYIALVSGQGPNPVTQSDCLVFQEFAPPVAPMDSDGQAPGSGCVYPESVKTIANQLEAKGKAWKGYMEDMANGKAGEPKSCRHPTPGTLDDTQSAEVGDQYATRHNPFVYFHSIIDHPTCAANDVDFSKLAGDIKSPATTPSYAFITPNLCSDGHDEPCVDGKPGGLVQINVWLKQHIPAILSSPGFKDNGLLIVTFDEAEATGDNPDSRACCDERAANTPNPGALDQGPGGGLVGAVMISRFIKPGTVANHDYNHYSLLRTVEDMFGLSHLGYAGSPNPGVLGSDIFNQAAGSGPKRGGLRMSIAPTRFHRWTSNHSPSYRKVTVRIRTSHAARVRLRGVCPPTRGDSDTSGRLSLTFTRPSQPGICTFRATKPGFRSATRFARVLR
jgi:phosphatidylinositol-3-phosphatase